MSQREKIEQQVGKMHCNFSTSPWDANGAPLAGYVDPLARHYADLARGQPRKDDAGKPRMELLPPVALEAVARVLTYGAQKYGAENWRGVERSRYIGAALRHVFAHVRGEKHDPETGESHLAHAACSLLFALETQR